MRRKSMEIVGTVTAIVAVLGAASGIFAHHRTRKDSTCRLARAECVSVENNRCNDAFSETTTSTNAKVEVGSGKKIGCSVPLFQNAKAAYVIEHSGKVPVFEKDSLKHLPIASMCKIMTLLLTFEAIDQGVLTENEMISVSENAAAMGGSQVFLEANAQYPLKELIKSIVVCSANDSCVALAERIAGSTDIFVDKMNARAKELGCENTLFANCTGLPKEPQYSCARDVAVMMSALIEHEDYFSYGKIWTDSFQHPQGRTTEITNTNRLVRFYDGCDGGKTGFTNEAGFCLAATAKRGNMRLISVVIGEKDSKTRFKEISESFDYTFANYTMQVVVDSNAPIQKSLAVSGGKEKSLPIKAQRDGLLFLKRGEVANVDVQVFVDSQKKAPIMQGETVGELRVFCDGIEKDRIPLIAAETIEKASYWDTFIDVAKDWNFCGR